MSATASRVLDRTAAARVPAHAGGTSVLLVALGVYAREGGMERYYQRLVTCLAELQAPGVVGEATLLALWDASAQRGSVPSGVSFLPQHSRKLRFLLTFLHVVLRNRPAVVLYGHVLLAPLVAIGRLVNPGARHLLIVHGVDVWERPSAATRWLVRSCMDAVVAVSAFTADKMQAAYGLPSTRFRKLPPALDTAHVRDGATPARPPILHGSRRLISVTRLSTQDTYKNIDKVILALPAILERHPDTHYYVVGEGDWRPALEELTRSQGVSEHVHFLGWIDDVARDAVYAGCDAFVLPSTGEGFGIVFLEAWQHGVPVIASNRDAATEVVRHGLDGLCVDPDPESVANAVLELLGDDARRAAMAASGRRRLAEHFTHEHFRQSLLEILAEQGASRASRAP